MKLSDFDVNIEAGEFLRGCQSIPSYPDAPQAVATFSAGNNRVSIISAEIAPIEETMLHGTVVGAELYKKLSQLEFFYIIVVINKNIEGAFVPDEIFEKAADAENYARSNSAPWTDLR